MVKPHRVFASPGRLDAPLQVMWVVRRIDLTADFPMVGMGAFSLGVGLGHVFALLRLSVVLITFAMIDLRRGVSPNLAGAAA